MKQLCAAFLIVCSLILSSCASSGRNAGKLSEAMDKSSDNHEGERKVTAVVVEDLEIEEYDENGNYAGTETISGDQLWGLDLNGSAGINLVQTENFVLGVEFNPGIIIWGLETYEGFTNDVFEPFFYFKTNFNFMIK